MGAEWDEYGVAGGWCEGWQECCFIVVLAFDLVRFTVVLTKKIS